MKRLVVVAMLALGAVCRGGAASSPFDGAEWIWHPQGQCNDCRVTLKRGFDVAARPVSARLVFSCDNTAVVRLNGAEIGRQGDGEFDWRVPTVATDFCAAFRTGANELTVEAENRGGRAGFIAALSWTDEKGAQHAVTTKGGAWQASLAADRKAAVSCGAYGAAPWKRFADGATGPTRMREVAADSDYASEWISAADAPVADKDARRRKQAPTGTSWFFATVENAGEVRKAEWAVSGLGVFEAFVNGWRIGGWHALKPGFTHVRKTRNYFVYDVTGVFRQAKGAVNQLSAEVSTGWWNDRISGYAGQRSAFRGELLVEYSDGRREVHCTRADGTWRAGVAGPVVRAGIFDGEIYDARVAVPKSAPADFKPAVANGEFRGETLLAPGAEIVRRSDLELKPVEAYCWKGVTGGGEDACGRVVKTRTFRAGEALRLAPGETLVVDFGQNASAVPHFRLRAKRGTVVTCLPGEMLNDANGERSRGNDGPGGSIYRANLRMPGTGMALVYTAAGKGVEDYYPRYTFFGYRYVSLTATDEVTFESLTSLPVTSITKEMELGRIETGDKDVNRLIANVYWGQLSNYLSVPTDCPQRDERQGWTADTQVFVQAGAFNADTSRFFHKWLHDLCDTQHDDGAFTGVAPLAQYSDAGSMRLGWSDAGVIVPYQVWRMFNDASIVEENWAAMERYVARLAATRGDQKALRSNYQWADWLSYEKLESNGGGAFQGKGKDRRPLPDAYTYWNYLYACYWLWDAQMMREMAAATGRDAAKYGKMAAEARAYLKKSFFSADDGLILPVFREMQTPALFALKFGLVEGAAREKTIAALRRNFRDHGDCLQTGFLGTSILMDTLTENGMVDVAYTLLLQHENPSWLYSVDQGATTIWERWNSYTKAKGFGPVSMNSFNHYAYGAVLAWLYKTAAGIEPRCGSLVMAPRPDRRLGFVKASYRTAQGVVTSAWRYEGEKWIWEFTVPGGMTAQVTLPGESEAKAYASGTHRVSIDAR